MDAEIRDCARGDHAAYEDWVRRHGYMGESSDAAAFEGAMSPGCGRR